jgi:hypothetical protein
MQYGLFFAQNPMPSIIGFEKLKKTFSKKARFFSSLFEKSL